eukprot:5458917-Pyramimonas_sp.AAC.1
MRFPGSGWMGGRGSGTKLSEAVVLCEQLSAATSWTNRATPWASATFSFFSMSRSSTIPSTWGSV